MKTFKFVAFCLVFVSGAAFAQGNTEALLDALAKGAIAIPEPSELALFVLGVAGLIIGRNASRKRAVPPERNELDE